MIYFVIVQLYANLIILCSEAVIFTYVKLDHFLFRRRQLFIIGALDNNRDITI